MRKERDEYQLTKTTGDLTARLASHLKFPVPREIICAVIERRQKGMLCSPLQLNDSSTNREPRHTLQNLKEWVLDMSMLSV